MQVFVAFVLIAAFATCVTVSAKPSPKIENDFFFPVEGSYLGTIKCPKNEILYYNSLSINVKPTSFCDCKPGFIYHEPTNACYEAFRQGPCDNGQFLILHKPTFQSKCVRNRCKEDGKIRFQLKCWKLADESAVAGPCSGDSVLAVSPITTLPECIDRTVLRQAIDDPKFNFYKKTCPENTVRDPEDGYCRPKLSV